MLWSKPHRFQVNAEVGFTGDRRTHNVHQAHYLGAALSRFAHGGKCIGCLTGLTDGNEQSLAIDNRSTVAELRSVLDFDGDPGQILHHVFPDQAAVP